MQTILQEQWQLLCRNHEQFWQTIEQQTAEQRNYRPTSDAWNLVQVSHHVWLAESSTLQFVTTKSARPSTLLQKMRSKLMSVMLNLLLNSPFKFKAPKVVLTEVDRQTMSYESIKTHWEATVKAWENYLDAFPVDKNTYLVFKHPVAGALNIFQTLQFMIDHCAHHQQQLNRIIATQQNHSN